MAVNGTAPQQALTISETTWLEGIVNVDSETVPGGKVLMLTLVNGHRYCIALKGATGKAIQRAVSPIEIPR